jgi:7-carboxy-7-deazaguanine synthase
VWCDTEHAFYGGEDCSVADVLERALAHEVELVEVTGGEPLAQRNVLPLMSALADAGRTVLLETSGAFDIAAVDERVHVIMDIKCPDSGEHDKNLWRNLEALRAKDEVKLVLASRRDYEFARELIRQHDLSARCSVLISTVWGGPPPADVARWMLEDELPARFQLQMHKLIWDPAARGV